ncbi:hypothetical protein L1987_46666 [Smallanthus sonchifolius]|uniref:Uncharacterized protein n=1 Tax=Smallanthus sonchifolius TaxID=185202 RepID=A0ACB9G1G6_9ASTR|nr:hypothetical protein L1987_46666 [Smallanthus sonchifolius]
MHPCRRIFTCCNGVVLTANSHDGSTIWGFSLLIRSTRFHYQKSNWLCIYEVVSTNCRNHSISNNHFGKQLKHLELEDGGLEERFWWKDLHVCTQVKLEIWGYTLLQNTTGLASRMRLRFSSGLLKISTFLIRYVQRRYWVVCSCNLHLYMIMNMMTLLCILVNDFDFYFSLSKRKWFL